MIGKIAYNKKEQNYCKRKNSFIHGIIEKSIAFVILVMLSPFILIILEFVFLITGESPVFIQKRGLILEGKFVDIYKIRTIKTSYKITNERSSSKIFYKEEYSKNVSPFCAFLRKTGLDEILQLINVLKGEMSILGPRPLMISDLELMKETEIDLYERRKQILSKPGITGYWQIFGIREKGVLDLIELEEFYEKNKSFKMDGYLILKTIIIMLTANHSDSIVIDLKNRLFVRNA